MRAVDLREHLGIGQRQPRDLIVTDMTRTHRLIVPGEHQPQIGVQIEHRTGRMDAIAQPAPVRVSRDEAEAIRLALGLSRNEMRAALNRMFQKGANHAKRR